MENLVKATRGFKGTLLIIAFFSFFANLLQLTIPLYMLQIYDRVLPSQSSNTLIFLSILAAFALIILGLTEMVRQILATRAAARLDSVLANDVMERVILEGHKSNGNIQPLRDLQAVRGIVSSKILFGVIDFPFSLIFIGCLYLVHPSLFWLTVIGALILLAVAILNLKFTEKASLEQAQASVTAHQQSEYFARNSDSIIAMGMMKDVVASWGNWNANALIAADKAANRNSIFGGLSRTIRFGIQAAMLGYGAYLVQQGEMTAGMIFASSIISGRALQPIDMVINSWPQLSAGRNAWRKVKDFVASTERREKYTEVAEPKGQLTAEGILQPNPLDRKKPPILNGISFKLPEGQSVAVIGPSGSGKSTLARIIIGAFKPFAGDIRIDGNNIANWDPQDLGKHVGYLAQDVELMPGTIAQNISRFQPDAKDEDIRRAAELAHVEDLIKKMPQGYDTPIGPGGLAVSGGEKQRLGLARAFYGNPKLLVLDEPNSSLDRIGENALLRALVAAKKNKITVFLVTQRDSVIQVVDNIMRMSDGKIIDYGPREEVIKITKERAMKAAKNKQQRSAGAGV
jgi:ATP-binding cassette subfamily C protein